MMDRPTMEKGLQKACSVLQKHWERLRALQAESAAQREQQQQQRKQLELLQQKRLQAQVLSQSLLCKADNTAPGVV